MARTFGTPGRKITLLRRPDAVELITRNDRQYEVNAFFSGQPVLLYLGPDPDMANAVHTNAQKEG